MKKTDKEDSKFDAIVSVVVILAVTAADFFMFHLNNLTDELMEVKELLKI